MINVDHGLYHDPYLIEGDIEKSASRQALQNPNGQHMSSTSLCNIYTQKYKIQKYKDKI